MVQRLSDLLPSTAETSEKLQAAQEVADGLAGKMVDDSRARAKQLLGKRSMYVDFAERRAPATTEAKEPFQSTAGTVGDS